LQHEALLSVVQELEKRGWLNKRWATRAGQECGGQPFTKTSLQRLLTNFAWSAQRIGVNHVPRALVRSATE
jgi:site-specific DNA recombinase